MSQFLRPDGDITTTNVNAGTFASIDETSADDADFVIGTNNTETIYECSLSNPGATPGSGTCTVRFRHAQGDHDTSPFAPADEGTAFTQITCALVEGTTVLATDATQTNSAAFVQREFTFSTSLVTDWNDLRLRFTITGAAGGPGNRRTGALSWAEIEVPDVGGVTYTKEFTDTLAVGDQQELGREFGRLFSDAVDVHSFGVERIFELLVSNKIQVVDTFSYQIVGGGPAIYTVTLSEFVAPTDQLVVERQRNLHFLDSIGVADQQYIMRERGRFLTDQIADILDSQHLSRQRGQLLDDAVTVIDPMFLSRERGRVTQDEVAVTDALLVSRYVLKVLDDFITVLDTFIKEISAGLIHTITLSDVVQLADALIVQRYRDRHFVDIVTVADEILSERQWYRAFDDRVVLSDGTIITAERLRHLSESLTITDTELHFLLRTVQASDAVDVTDDTLAFRLRFRDLVDAFSVFDDFSLVVSGAIQPLTVEVRVRLGLVDAVLLGQHAPIRLGMAPPPLLGQSNTIRLGADAPPQLGGYN